MNVTLRDKFKWLLQIIMKRAVIHSWLVVVPIYRLPRILGIQFVKPSIKYCSNAISSLKIKALLSQT